MVLHLDDINWVQDKHPLVEELGKLVNKKYNPGIDAVLEVTFNYAHFWDGKRYNTSLFQEYAWVKREDNGSLVLTREKAESLEYDSIPWFRANYELDYEDLKEVFLSKCNEDRSRFEDLATRIQNESLWNLENYWIWIKEKRILLDTITKSIHLIDAVINSADFELEKAWYIHGLQEQEIYDKIKITEWLETRVFGPKIIDNERESLLSLVYLNKWIDTYEAMSNNDKQQKVWSIKGSRVLNNEELTRLKLYRDRMQWVISENWYKIWTVKPTKKQENPTTKLFEKLSNVSIPRDTIINLMQWSIGSQWMRQTVKLSNRKNPYDGPEIFEFPNSEDYASLSFERVLRLLVHEISGHYINQATHEAGVNGNTRLDGNIEKEEWLAKLLELTMQWKSVTGEDVISPAFITVLAGEIFAWEELTDFIDLYTNISERKTTPENTSDRRNRLYPDGYVWVQHKDVTYVRGLLRIVDFLQWSGNIENLFVWKVWLDAIENGDIKFDQENMLFPILIAEVLLYYIMSATSSSGNTENMKFIHVGFIEYMKEKYKWLVNEESFQKLIDAKLNFWQLKGLMKNIAPLLLEIKEQTSDDAIKDSSERVSSILSWYDKKAA